MLFTKMNIYEWEIKDREEVEVLAIARRLWHVTYT